MSRIVFTKGDPRAKAYGRKGQVSFRLRQQPRDPISKRWKRKDPCALCASLSSARPRLTNAATSEAK